MATLMTPAQRKAAFLAEGLTVVEVPGYQTNDRAPVTGLAASPKYGTLNHHTGGDTSNPYGYASGILFQGRSDLPGPLCHEGLDIDKGVVYMIGSGRTNHAGAGDPDTLALFKADAMPLDREVRPDQASGVDGNSALYGLEMMYSGLRDLPRVGWVAMVKWNAAYCRFNGWTGGSVGGHREWTNQKPDPGHVDLAQLRRDVNAALALPPGVWGSSVAPPPPKEDDMPTPDELWKYQFRLNDDKGNLLTWATPIDLLTSAWKQDNAQTAALKSLTDTVANLAAANGADVSAEDVERWIKEGIAESVKVTGTLTVEPQNAPAASAAPDAAPGASQDAAPACADANDPLNA